MRVPRGHEETKKYAWVAMQQAAEYAQLHAWAQHHGTPKQEKKFFSRWMFYVDCWQDMLAGDDALMIHLQMCQVRHRRLLRAAAKMPLPE